MSETQLLRRSEGLNTRLEADHIGQIALLRRIYGLPAMRWA